MPSVSVIIPTFNRSKLLREAIRSVLQQTVAPDEIIIIDDGSTDDTAEVCTEFESKIRYRYQPNAGLPTARNKGVAESTGDFIAFLDSDDLWDPQKLETQLTMHRLWPELGWTATECVIVGPDGSAVGNSRGIADGFPVFRAVRKSPQDFFGTRLRRTSFSQSGESHEVFLGDAFELFFHGNFVFPSSVLLRRSVWEQVGPFDPAFLVAQDNEFFHRVAAESPLGIVMAPLLGYRVGLTDKNTSSKNTTSLIRNAIESVDRAARLPRGMTEQEGMAYRTGRRRLVSRLAYAQLSVIDRQGVRRTLSAASRDGTMPMKPDMLLLYASSLLPSSALRLAHGIKRGIAATARWSRLGAGRKGDARTHADPVGSFLTRA